MYKYLGLTSQRTNSFSFTESNNLMLFGVAVAVCCKNHTKPMNPLRVLKLNGTAGP
jgi:hypothetical protein